MNAPTLWHCENFRMKKQRLAKAVLYALQQTIHFIGFSNAEDGLPVPSRWWSKSPPIVISDSSSYKVA